MKLFSALCMTVSGALLVGCAQTARIGSIADGEYGLILADTYWLMVDEVDPGYLMVTVDGERTSDLVAFFTYKEAFRVAPGPHEVEFVCDFSFNRLRSITLSVDAGYAYYLGDTVGSPVACPSAVAEVPIADIDRLREPPFDFLAAGARVLSPERNREETVASRPQPSPQDPPKQPAAVPANPYVAGGMDWAPLVELALSDQVNHTDRARILASYYQKASNRVDNVYPPKDQADRCEIFRDPFGEHLRADAEDYRDDIAELAAPIYDFVRATLPGSTEAEPFSVFQTAFERNIMYAYGTGEPPMCVCGALALDHERVIGFCEILRPFLIIGPDGSVRQPEPFELAHWTDPRRLGEIISDD